ncbi:type II toxin-antitoxin system RelE/ParE family toxin [Rhodoferax sp.]|uniref:type II toxin-antitoxin system RelE/ParE family toxin n=1 Tax=Rhodoferax sp. TaxID=50421 RepID=UPI002735EAB5|nr:type II toxin-antitoxin system RelE/ParE family toxin [Rhodoferax sp.]MDP3193027.1 type II toxin-antitoxin system RelE/ParE family toxin [Rhodoferax sp.]MDP3336438.1 type II toxin-antitoxin system RelE/ParE family toxin [Rhodoferax sp.]
MSTQSAHRGSSASREEGFNDAGASLIQLGLALNLLRSPDVFGCLVIYITKWHNLTMSRVFKTRYFSRWMRKTELKDEALCAAVSEMMNGLIDADLGGGVVKKRVGLAGRGKRGGVRTLVATNKGSRWFFVYGFEKNDRANIADDELEALKGIAAQLLSITGQQINKAVADGALQEICNDDKI